MSKKQKFVNLIKTSEFDQEGYNEMVNLCITRPNDIPFYQWVKNTDWTLQAIIEFFKYQTLCLNGEIDWQEFEEEYTIFKTKIYACLN